VGPGDISRRARAPGGRPRGQTHRVWPRGQTNQSGPRGRTHRSDPSGSTRRPRSLDHANPRGHGSREAGGVGMNANVGWAEAEPKAGRSPTATTCPTMLGFAALSPTYARPALTLRRSAYPFRALVVGGSRAGPSDRTQRAVRWVPGPRHQFPETRATSRGSELQAGPEMTRREGVYRRAPDRGVQQALEAQAREARGLGMRQSTHRCRPGAFPRDPCCHTFRTFVVAGSRAAQSDRTERAARWVPGTRPGMTRREGGHRAAPSRWRSRRAQPVAPSH
jgi:hypothetical protein